MSYELMSNMVTQWRRSGIFIVNFELISHLFSSVPIVNFEHLIAGWESSLREKCPHSEFFWSVFSPNDGKYGPKKLKIQKLFTQWLFLLEITLVKQCIREFMYMVQGNSEFCKQINWFLFLNIQWIFLQLQSSSDKSYSSRVEGRGF